MSEPNPNTKYKLTDAEPAAYAQRPAGRRRVLVCIPSHSGQLEHICQNSFLRARDLANSLGISVGLSERLNDSCLERARDVMFSEFLDRYPDHDDMVFWDSDIGCEPEGFIKLLSHPVDVVGAAYPSRGEPEAYVLRSIDNELQRDKATGLMEVEGIATGFLRITRRAAVKMAEAYKDDWYTDPTAVDLKIRHLFEFDVRDHRLFSEDYNFCRKWRALGEKCWIDPEQTLHHIGKKIYSGNLMRWLESNAPKIPDSVAKGDAAAHFATPPSPLDVAKAFIAQEDKA